MTRFARSVLLAGLPGLIVAGWIVTSVPMERELPAGFAAPEAMVPQPSGAKILAAAGLASLFALMCSGIADKLGHAARAGRRSDLALLRSKAFFVLATNGLFFFSLGLGSEASRFIHRGLLGRGLWDEGVYFLGLLLAAAAISLVAALGKLTAAPLRPRLVLALALVVLFALLVTLSTLENFQSLAPFGFNLLFALLFSLLLLSLDISQCLRRGEP